MLYLLSTPLYGSVNSFRTYTVCLCSCPSSNAALKIKVHKPLEVCNNSFSPQNVIDLLNSD